MRSTLRCVPRVLHDKAPCYPIWFCKAYPVEQIQFSRKQELSHKVAYLPALLENIKKNGLVNPLIILNHRDPKQYLERYVMTGTNRLWCIKQLGWKVVPAIVTGTCEHDCVPVKWHDIGKYFPDGTIYLGHQGPRITNYSDFLKGEFPNAKGWKGVGPDG